MCLFLNGIKKGNKVIIIDDIIDTGGTLLALIEALRLAQAEILGAMVLVERVENNGKLLVRDKTGVEVNTLIKLDTSGSFSKIIDFKA